MESQIKKIIKAVLEKNNWGIYFKGEPLTVMPVNGGPNVYKVSDVRFDELEGAISEQIQDIVRSINTQEESECQENQMRESSKEQ
jgi:hypothetical protein|tara:strand:+ start:551 stop:805 length:255 start_codon:yes stop_codon:yes gene_type:complete